MNRGLGAQPQKASGPIVQPSALKAEAEVADRRCDLAGDPEKRPRGRKASLERHGGVFRNLNVLATPWTSCRRTMPTGASWPPPASHTQAGSTLSASAGWAVLRKSGHDYWPR